MRDPLFESFVYDRPSPVAVLAGAINTHRERTWGSSHVLDAADEALYEVAESAMPSILMDEHKALMLADAIEHHRDESWQGRPVRNAIDGTLYNAALWLRSMQAELLGVPA